MVKNPPLGLEFNLGGFELSSESHTGLSDPFYADLVLRIMDVARTEGYMPLSTPYSRDESLTMRMHVIAEVEASRSTMHDHEVPAILGMSRIALARLRGESPERWYDRGYRDLSSEAIQTLINSLEGYEHLRDQV